MGIVEDILLASLLLGGVRNATRKDLNRLQKKEVGRMNKTYCDLCKKEIESPKYKFLIRTDDGCTINSITSIMHGIEYDLCDVCKDKIMAYVNDTRR